MHAEGFENGAHRTPGDNAGSGGCRAQHDASGSMPASDVMMQGAALPQRNPNERTFRRIGSFADSLWNLAGFAMAIADPALLIADDDKRSEAEPAAALHHLGNAIDMDQTVHKFAIAILAVAAAAAFPFTRH
jgi:hypothetical protein